MSQAAAETASNVQSTTASPALRQNTPARWSAPRCGYHASAAMLWVGSHFLWVGYALVWLVAIYFYLCVPRARRASKLFLDRVRAAESPLGSGRSALLRSWQTYRHMVEFGLLMLDRALMLARPGHGFTIDCEGLPHLTSVARVDSIAENSACANSQSAGVILLTAHLGMAEIAAPHMHRMGLIRPIHIVMYQDKNDGTEAFHTRHRRMLANIAVISTTDPLTAGVKIISALKKGDVVAMRGDRTLAGKSVEVRLLGSQVVIPAGPFMAAALTGAPVVYIYNCRIGYRHYRCTIPPVRRYGDDQPGTREQRIARAAQDFADHLESQVRQHPYQWSNFYDFWTVQRPAP